MIHACDKPLLQARDIMDEAVYPKMREVEDRHWWYRAKRRGVHGLLTGAGAAGPVLEIGCGTGGNAEFLSGYGPYTGMDMHEPAVRYVRERGYHAVRGTCDRDGIHVSDGALPDGGFGIIAMLDVLEHIEDDGGVLSSLHAYASRTTCLALSVPLHPWLFGPHDLMLHHKRRYRIHELMRTLDASGWYIRIMRPYMVSLFPMAAFKRFMDRMSGEAASTDRLPHPWMNACFTGVMAYDHAVLNSAARVISHMNGNSVHSMESFMRCWHLCALSTILVACPKPR
jgi:SAM-dependent methyltransferase